MCIRDRLAGELLTEVYLPRHLKRIGTYAFYFCRQLKILHVQGELEMCIRDRYILEQ